MSKGRKQFLSTGSAPFSTIASTGNVPRCYVRHRHLDLYLGHFSEWWIVTIVKEYFIGKLFIFTPLIPLKTPRLDQHLLYLAIRDEIGNQAKVQDGYGAALGGKQFVIKWRSGELTITCQNSDTRIEDITEVVNEKAFHYVSENDVPFTVDTSSISGKSVIITYILNQSGVMKKIAFTMQLQEQETSRSENPNDSTASSPGKRSPLKNLVTDAHIGGLSKLLNPDLFYDLHVALGIEYCIAEGIKLNKATSDLPQQFTKLLHTWNARSTRTLADLNNALKEAGAGSLRIPEIVEEQGSETIPTTPCPMYETAFTDEIKVNDYHILKISKLLLQDNLSDLRVALGIGYSIADDITQLTPRVFERYIHLLQKWKAKSPKTVKVKQLKEILVQIDLGGIVNMLENEL